MLNQRAASFILLGLDLHVPDVVLLCLDGLTEMVSEEQIAAILQQEMDPQCACERLVSEANKQGGKDNITAIVARFMTTEPTQADPEKR